MDYLPSKISQKKPFRPILTYADECHHITSNQEQADEQGLMRYVYPRFTRVVNITGKKLEIYKADALIADSAVRNEQIIMDAEKAVAEGRTLVILTKLKQNEEIKKEMFGVPN